MGFLTAGASLSAAPAQLTFSWKDNSNNEAGFRIERSADGTRFAQISTVAANVTTYVDSGLPAGTKFWYRARAFNANGLSAYSPVASAVSRAAGDRNGNAAPTITPLMDRVIRENTTSGVIAFTIGDTGTAASRLTLVANSSNLALVPVANVKFGGSGANRTVTVMPARNQTGWSTIWIKVSDGALTAVTSFVLTVERHSAPANAAPTNTAPTISALADHTVAENESTGAISVTIGDAQSGAGSLTLIGNSSNPALVPVSNIRFGGSGANRTVTVVPAANQSGWSTIWVKVSDGVLSTVRSFVMNVSPRGRVLNLSTRIRCDGPNPVTTGFVINGGATKRVLLRAIGPTLKSSFGMPDTLPNPRITLRRWDGARFVDVATNLDWHANTNRAAIAAATADVFAFGLPSASVDAALLLDLPAGQYTAEARDQGGRPGLALVEVYDVSDAGTAKFTNLSARGHVGTGNDVLIAGFVLSDASTTTVLIRAVGPGIAVAPYHVPGTLADPVIELYRRESTGVETRVATQNDWGTHANAAHTAEVARQVSAFALPAGSKDAAFVMTLAPGTYTAVVRGADGRAGMALTEVYVVP